MQCPNVSIPKPYSLPHPACIERPLPKLSIRASRLRAEANIRLRVASNIEQQPEDYSAKVSKVNRVPLTPGHVRETSMDLFCFGCDLGSLA